MQQCAGSPDYIIIVHYLCEPVCCFTQTFQGELGAGQPVDFLWVHVVSKLCPGAVWLNDNWKIIIWNLWLNFVFQYFGKFGPSQVTKRGQKMDFKDNYWIWWGHKLDLEDEFRSKTGQGHSLVIRLTYVWQMLDIGHCLDKLLRTNIVNQHPFFVFMTFPET